jgi:hypothetical protein
MNRVTSIKGVAAEKGVRQLSSHWSLYAMFTFNGSGGRNRYTFEEVMVQGGVENVYLGLLSHDLSSLQFHIGLYRGYPYSLSIFCTVLNYPRLDRLEQEFIILFSPMLS